MTKPGVIGLVGREQGEMVLRLYSTERRKLFAVVVGSQPYVERALAAAGLGAPPVRLAEERGGRSGLLGQRTLIRSQPANGNAKLPRKANDGRGLHASGTFSALKP
jgi:hypothetical protein